MNSIILILGAGRSSGAAIDYLIDHSVDCGWEVWVADLDEDLAYSKTKNRPHSKVFRLGQGTTEREALIKQAKVVISMLPPSLHLSVAESCLRNGAHLITASYLDKSMKELDSSFSKAGLLFLGEMGVDPGIDHMSAMSKIDEIKENGGELISFKSFTGGLIDQSSDSNPWHYKITWNPMNVVKAGQGVAQFIQDDRKAFIPYSRLFSDIEKIDVLGHGEYEGYANRNSLDYLKIYNIEDIPTLKRGTLRHNGFCEAWDCLIKLGLTESQTNLDFRGIRTYEDLLNALFPGKLESAKERVIHFLGITDRPQVIHQLDWLGLFSDREIEREEGSLADLLYDLIVDKWHMEQEDKDLVIMQHEFIYKSEDQKRKAVSTLIQRGKDKDDTAMSRLVGLPLAIFTRLLLLDKYKGHGVKIPTEKEIYIPVLEELSELGITFREWDVALH